MHRISTLLLVLTLGCAFAAETSGTVVRTTDDSVVIAVGTEEKTFPVGETTEITVDGAQSLATDLRPGQKVTITHEGDEASRIVVTTSKAPAQQPDKKAPIQEPNKQQ